MQNFVHQHMVAASSAKVVVCRITLAVVCAGYLSADLGILKLLVKAGLSAASASVVL
jgi:hypothetical protein